MKTRSEHDLLGDENVPANVYWGVHTARAIANFPVTGTPISTYPQLVVALADVKEAAALTNRDLGLIPAELANAIIDACHDVRSGALNDQFVVDVIQGGAGTSTNMNANEVIANRALEILGHELGEYDKLHPNDHVNLSQSTNDAYPTAIRIALIRAAEDLEASLAKLEGIFGRRADDFRGMMKMGRTQLQDAVPMTLGQEFHAYKVMVGEDRQRIVEAAKLLHEVNLGATAIGTGINAPAGYALAVCGHLRNVTGLPMETAADLIAATQECGGLVHLSGVLKRIAVKLSKICNDLRLLSSGPRAGFGEITLPAVQAGSSIMPGKVNPVIPEVVNQVAFEVIGNDVTVSMAAEGGQLQLNAFEPVIFHSLMKSITHLAAAAAVLGDRCVAGIVANESTARGFVENSIGLVTALSPVLGYAGASDIAKLALASNRAVADLVLEQKLLTEEQLRELLEPERLVGPELPSTPAVHPIAQ